MQADLFPGLHGDQGDMQDYLRIKCRTVAGCLIKKRSTSVLITTVQEFLNANSDTEIFNAIIITFFQYQ